MILALPEPVWIDVEAAAAEVPRALDALERGDARRAWALAQVPLNIASRGLLPGAQASWLEPPRRELEDVRLQALEVIGRAGLVMGGTQLQSAERAARTLIESEPYRESGYVLLMEALARAATSPRRMRVFDGLRTLLRDELGTSPRPRRSPSTSGCCDRRARTASRAAHPTGAGRSGDPAARRAAPAGPGAADRARAGDCRARRRCGIALRRDGAGAGSRATPESQAADRAPGRRCGDRQDHAHRRARAGASTTRGRSCSPGALRARPWCPTSRSWRRSGTGR